MAWYGPSGECGCCGEAGDCFCPVECECPEPELRGRYATRKTITLSNFPAALEDHGTIACGDPSNPYKSVYWGVFGLNQLNDTYVLNRYPNCDSNTYKIFTCSFQVAEGLCRPTIPEACNNLSGSFQQYDVECLAIVSDNYLQVLIEESALTLAYPCFVSFGLQFYYGRYWGNWFETALGYRDRWCQEATTHPILHRNFLLYGTDTDDTYCNNPFALTTANCRKTPAEDFLVVQSDFAATLSGTSSLPLSGYLLEISEFTDEVYIRAYGTSNQESYLIEGLTGLNGSYLTEINRATCEPTFAGYSVPITVKAYSISTTSPCFFAEIFRQTTGTAYLTTEVFDPGNTGIKVLSVTVTLVFDDLHDYYMTGLQFPYIKSVATVIDCTENCGEVSDSDLCIDSPISFKFKACTSPVF